MIWWSTHACLRLVIQNTFGNSFDILLENNDNNNKNNRRVYFGNNAQKFKVYPPNDVKQMRITFNVYIGKTLNNIMFALFSLTITRHCLLNNFKIYVYIY